MFRVSNLTNFGVGKIDLIGKIVIFFIKKNNFFIIGNHLFCTKLTVLVLKSMFDLHMQGTHRLTHQSTTQGNFFLDRAKLTPIGKIDNFYKQNQFLDYFSALLKQYYRPKFLNNRPETRGNRPVKATTGQAKAQQSKKYFQIFFNQED